MTFGNVSGISTNKKKKKILKNCFLSKSCYRTGSKMVVSALPCLAKAEPQPPQHQRHRHHSNIRFPASETMSYSCFYDDSQELGEAPSIHFRLSERISSETRGDKEEPATKLNKPTQLLDIFTCHMTSTKDLDYWHVSGHVAPPSLGHF